MKAQQITEGYACFTLRMDIAVSPMSEKSGILILESDPEQGYFSRGDFPENLAKVSDHHLYIVTKKPIVCFQDWVIRHSCYVKNKLKINLHISPGQLTYKNKQHNCIRIRTREVDALKPFLTHLKTFDIDFEKHKNTAPFNSVVYYKKYIQFQPIEERIYADLNDNRRHFIELPYNINFEEFEKLIEQVKNNYGFNLFNAVMVSLTRRNRIMDMVAIISNDCDESRLPEFKTYLDKHTKNKFA